MSEARQEYFWAAVSALRSFANEELAFAEFEAVAKLIEVHIDRTPFEPHHLTEAKNYLLGEGELATDAQETRGGREVPILRTALELGRSRQIEERSSRKRLLLGRYYGYTQGSQSTGEGLTGMAGELATQRAIARAGVGTSLATTFRDRPSVPELFGQKIPHGPLDNALMLQPLTVQLEPRPPYGVLVPIEVKNLREWVYPHTKELFQLLAKGLQIQRQHPTRAVIPLIVCRRLHPTMNFMAKDLGFFAIDSRRHYFPVHSRIDPERFAELRIELGLADATQDLDATGRIEAGLKALQRKYDVEDAAARWRSLSERDDIVNVVERLRIADGSGRRTLMEVLRELARAWGATRGW